MFSKSRNTAIVASLSELPELGFIGREGAQFGAE
jgi:hypothetical protein